VELKESGEVKDISLWELIFSPVGFDFYNSFDSEFDNS
jgi:hypothetical protein